MDAIPPDAPAPRLCHVIKRPDFEGFGFNLFAGKVKTGQFIGKVDAGSPAEDAGLKPGDRIIEVNGVHIGVENHKQVVQRIKLRPNETELLVVDDETDEYYASRGLTIKSTNSNVIRKRSSPAPEPARKISSSSSESESEQQKQAARLQQQQQQQQAYVTNGQRRESSSSEGEDWSNAPAPRLCHVIKWNENDGFGFHLLADKKRKGQFIGKVDAGSAAEAAGLKLSDRIVEVNGHNVVEETHKQVVQRIKAVANETKLLVIDPQGQLYYAERSVTITSSMPNVQKMRTPATPPQRMNNRPDNLKLAVTTAITETNGSSMASPPKSSLKRVSSAPAPRLCHVIKWRQDAGYGFHLLADKKRVGHFIGKVDPNTPASAGGLKVGDRIIEVNGHNVVNETHKQIVERIKSVSNETKLLVLDPEADLYYRERDIMVSSSQSNVVLIKTPAAPRATNESSDDDDDDYEVKLRSKGSRSPPSRSSVSPLTSPTSPTRPLSMATIAAAANSGLNLNMSAAQLRARLAAQKKYDPKREAMDLRRKHEIIQTM